MNRFIPFTVQSNDPNSINSPKSHFWDIFDHIGHLSALPGLISEFCHMREWWPMLLHHNRNRFRPFPAKSNYSNSINSQKNLFFDIFCHLGHLSGLFGPISEFCHMSEWWPTLPYHNRKRFRPFPAKSNDSNWIRGSKSMFLHFIRFFRVSSQKGRE